MLGPLMRRLDFVFQSPKLMARAWSLWPPFLAAGIRIEHIDNDFRFIRVAMPLKGRNMNYVGTHFGGSLYAMTDPFFMAMFMHNLGPGYVVWDKSARIDFIKPGRDTVRVELRLTQADIDNVLSSIEKSPQNKTLWEGRVDILDEAGALIAAVDKVVYIRKK